jgi:hypothetical protein
MELPEIGDRVLVVVGGEWCIATFKGENAGSWAWDFDTWGLKAGEIDHWQPLPPLPEDTPAWPPRHKPEPAPRGRLMDAHPDPEVRAALTRLLDALCSWERSTSRESVLILREVGGFEVRACSGKPLADDNPAEDYDLFAVVNFY